MTIEHDRPVINSEANVDCPGPTLTGPLRLRVHTRPASGGVVTISMMVISEDVRREALSAFTAAYRFQRAGEIERALDSEPALNKVFSSDNESVYEVLQESQ